MPSRSQTRTPDQKPAAGGSSSPTKAATGTIAAAATDSASTCAADVQTARKPRSTGRVVTVKQALEVAQDIVLLAHDAGLHAFIVNTVRDGAAIVLVNTYYCAKCRMISHGTVCTNCGGQK